MYRQHSFTDLFAAKHRRVLTIAIVLPILTNFAGINYVLLYATSFFIALDGGNTYSILLTQLAGLIEVICAFCVFIYIEKVGRKRLLMIGSAVLCVINMVIAIIAINGSTVIEVAILFILHIIAWNLFYGPVLWVFWTEMLNIQAFALAGFINWFVFAIQILVGGLTDMYSKPVILFWIYAGVCAVNTIFIAFYTFETKGRTLKEIKETLLK